LVKVLQEAGTGLGFLHISTQRSTLPIRPRKLGEEMDESPMTESSVACAALVPSYQINIPQQSPTKESA
jgi:hypothetical protein